MEQWQQDLLDTQVALKERLAKLADFTASEVIDLLEQNEQTLIRKEQAAVAEYLCVVSARISYF